jgi:hypothetical protein
MDALRGLLGRQLCRFQTWVILNGQTAGLRECERFGCDGG